MSSVVAHRETLSTPSVIPTPHVVHSSILSIEFIGGKTCAKLPLPLF